MTAVGEQHAAASFTLLGVESMDATHREFIELVSWLAEADKAEFAEGFARLVAHTQRHFEHESRLMRACRFSAIGEHENDHSRVLGELAFMQRQVDAGRIFPVRSYIRQLPDWFNTHLLTMDAALAASLKQQDQQQG